MKYIRTKDGRISYLSREPDEEITDYEIITSKGTLTYRREDEVIKTADTIEELCDEFVSVYKNLTPELLEPKFVSPSEPLSVSWKNRLEDEHLFKYNDVYGAIWTSKGLVYVAKMNESGCLELIWKRYLVLSNMMDFMWKQLNG